MPSTGTAPVKLLTQVNPPYFIACLAACWSHSSGWARPRRRSLPAAWPAPQPSVALPWHTCGTIRCLAGLSSLGLPTLRWLGQQQACWRAPAAAAATPMRRWLTSALWHRCCCRFRGAAVAAQLCCRPATPQPTAPWRCSRCRQAAGAGQRCMWMGMSRLWRPASSVAARQAPCPPRSASAWARAVACWQPPCSSGRRQRLLSWRVAATMTQQ